MVAGHLDNPIATLSVPYLPGNTVEPHPAAPCSVAGACLSVPYLPGNTVERFPRLGWATREGSFSPLLTGEHSGTGTARANCAPSFWTLSVPYLPGNTVELAAATSDQRPVLSLSVPYLPGNTVERMHS